MRLAICGHLVSNIDYAKRPFSKNTWVRFIEEHPQIGSAMSWNGWANSARRMAAKHDLIPRNLEGFGATKKNIKRILDGKMESTF